jgi:hypothetical protein
LILAVRSANGAGAAGVALDVTIKGEPPLRRLAGLPLAAIVGVFEP